MTIRGLSSVGCRQPLAHAPAVCDAKWQIRIRLATDQYLSWVRIYINLRTTDYKYKRLLEPPFSEQNLVRHRVVCAFCVAGNKRRRLSIERPALTVFSSAVRCDVAFLPATATLSAASWSCFPLKKKVLGGQVLHEHGRDRLLRGHSVVRCSMNGLFILLQTVPCRLPMRQ